ncbi:MAG: adenylyl-sulfate kinase [Candidatus Omnitrophota bacterium]
MKKRGKKDKGWVIHLTGISGSGKTTLGRALLKALAKEGPRPADIIDGDMYRDFAGIEKGYAPEERLAITKAMAFAAFRLAENGVDVIFCNIAGSYEAREFLRKKWKRYIQVFLDARIEDCVRNDPKGVYRKVLSSGTPECYGIDVAYEKPRKPDVTVYPYKESAAASLERVRAYLRGKKVIG